MEVLTLFTNSKDVLEAFSEFIYAYPKLILNGKDEDTAYFINPLTDRNEIYYHFILNDVEVEFSYNYTEEDQFTIYEFFCEEEFYFFDIQYKQESFLKEMMDAFRNFLVTKGLDKKVLIHHPFNDFFELKNF